MQLLTNIHRLLDLLLRRNQKGKRKVAYHVNCGGTVFVPTGKTLLGWAAEHFGCVIRPVKKKSKTKTKK